MPDMLNTSLTVTNDSHVNTMMHADGVGTFAVNGAGTAYTDEHVRSDEPMPEKLPTYARLHFTDEADIDAAIAALVELRSKIATHKAVKSAKQRERAIDELFIESARKEGTPDSEIVDTLVRCR